MRKWYDEDLEKVMPLMEDKRQTKLIINFLHKTGFGNIRIGRNIHLCVWNTIKANYNRIFGFY